MRREKAGVRGGDVGVYDVTVAHHLPANIHQSAQNGNAHRFEKQVLLNFLNFCVFTDNQQHL